MAGLSFVSVWQRRRPQAMENLLPPPKMADSVAQVSSEGMPMRDQVRRPPALTS